MIVETMRILLAVGSAPNISLSRASIKSGLDLLINSFVIPPHPRLLLILKYMHDFKNDFKQSFELMDLLLRYDTTENIVTQAAVKIVIQSAMELVQTRERVTHIPGNSDPYDEMIYNLGDIFRYFVLVDPVRVENILRPLNDRNDVFIMFFIYVAGYSSQPGRSKKLLHVLLTAFRANTVNKIRLRLPRVYRTMKESTTQRPKLCSFTMAALKCIRSVKTQFTLQAIARLAINRAMTTRSLDSSLTCFVPVHLRAFVLRQE